MLDHVVADDEIEFFGGKLDRLQIADDRFVRDVVALDLTGIDVDERDLRDIQPVEGNIGGRAAACLVNRDGTRAEMARKQPSDIKKGSGALGIAARRRRFGGDGNDADCVGHARRIRRLRESSAKAHNVKKGTTAGATYGYLA